MAMSAMTDTGNKTDQEIQRDVLAELKWDARVQPNEIGVVVKQGVVSLTGTVDAYTKKWAAEDAAHRVRGVRAVANDIDVRLPISSDWTDSDVAAAIVNQLKWDVFLPSDKIQVTVSKGWVTLRGEVEWQYQKVGAERIVRNVKGVTGVSNLMVVAPKIKPSDLKQKIESALIRSVKLDAENIAVEVQGNKVILKGTVRSLAEKQEAERAAWLAPGIASVENQILVSYN
jgi:osmotically-inducible protein OsmY